MFHRKPVFTVSSCTFAHLPPSLLSSVALHCLTAFFPSAVQWPFSSPHNSNSATGQAARPGFSAIPTKTLSLFYAGRSISSSSSATHLLILIFSSLIQFSACITLRLLLLLLFNCRLSAPSPGDSRDSSSLPFFGKSAVTLTFCITSEYASLPRTTSHAFRTPPKHNNNRTPQCSPFIPNAKVHSNTMHVHVHKWQTTKPSLDLISSLNSIPVSSSPLSSPPTLQSHKTSETLSIVANLWMLLILLQRQQS